MSSKTQEDGFLYFAYGSNLSSKRIHINNPSATFQSAAKLKDYKFGFSGYSKRWGGHSATITPVKGEVTWGVLWKLATEHLATLDEQEGVHHGVYRRFTVQVESASGDLLTCYSYEKLNPHTEGTKPSPQYKQVILTGAKEHGLPPSYIGMLEAIDDNGYAGEVHLQSRE